MDILFSVFILICSVIIHEISHGYAALALGDKTALYAGRLTLNPLPHIDLFGSVLLPGLLILTQSPFLIGWAKPVPYNPYNLRNQQWGPALVGAAGPLSNLLLALLFGLVIRFFLLPSAPSLAPEFFSLAASVVFINLLLAVFNLIPIPPLDGSKVLFAVLPYSLHWLEETLERYGIVLLFIVIFFFFRFLYPFIGLLFFFFTGQHI